MPCRQHPVPASVETKSESMGSRELNMAYACRSLAPAAYRLRPNTLGRPEGLISYFSKTGNRTPVDLLARKELRGVDRGRPRVLCNSGKMNRAREGDRARGKCRMHFLRYLRRRLAALKIVSSETSGNPSSLSFSPTCRHKFALSITDWLGTPSGYSSLITRSALSSFGRLLRLASVSLEVGWGSSLEVGWGAHRSSRRGTKRS